MILARREKIELGKLVKHVYSKRTYFLISIGMAAVMAVGMVVGMPAVLVSFPKPPWVTNII